MVISDCTSLSICSQHTFSLCDVVRILHGKATAHPVVVTLLFAACGRLSGDPGEIAENVPLCVPIECESIRTVVAAAMEFSRTETITSSPSQKADTLRVELFRQRRKLENNL
jgi:hypothetical protein